MDNIANPVCGLVCDLLSAHGVEIVVSSPGSRNAPLIVAMNRSGAFRMFPVVDERTAAFIALGMALRTAKPVAIVCTSGTAMLNYAPALAEAAHRNIPLIAITADRPERWVDRLDSQTIRQVGALDSVVASCVDVPASAAHDRQLFDLANLRINEALSHTSFQAPMPVHINVQLDVPLTAMTSAPPAMRGRCIKRLKAIMNGNDRRLLELMSTLKGRKVLVIAGGAHPSPALSEAVYRLAKEEIAPVLCEAQSNLPDAWRIAWIERNLKNLPPEMQPEVVVTFGGSLVSGRLKKCLREVPSLQHIALGYTDAFADTFGAIYRQVECEPEIFLNMLADYPADEEFTALWWQKEFEWTAGLDSRLAAQPLLSAFAFLGSQSRDVDVFISNGSAIRYAQQCQWESDWVDCNRGVSGIDGSTSTALGSALISGRPTLLITGDMSADYDIGVLINCDIPDNFRILILDNGGADIFRNIGTTGSLPERDRFFVLPRRMPYRDICANFGGEFFEMTPGVEGNLDDTLARFLSCGSPAMAVMHINPEISKNLL